MLFMYIVNKLKPLVNEIKNISNTIISVVSSIRLDTKNWFRDIFSVTNELVIFYWGQCYRKLFEGDHLS